MSNINCVFECHVCELDKHALAPMHLLPGGCQRLLCRPQLCCKACGLRRQLGCLCFEASGLPLFFQLRH